MERGEKKRRKFFSESFFYFSKLDKKKCPKMKNEKKSLKKAFVYCIIEN